MKFICKNFLFRPYSSRTMLKSLIFIATLHLIHSQVATTCQQTEFLIGNAKFNVNHLKDHRPPAQNYKEAASLYGKQDNNNYVFFNLMDYVRATKIDGHTIAANCQPRQIATKASINSPSACIPEPNPSTNCLDKKFCWTAIGACDNVTTVLIDEVETSKGVRLIYGGGDDPAHDGMSNNLESLLDDALDDIVNADYTKFSQVTKINKTIN
eukprot:sb/3470171/